MTDKIGDMVKSSNKCVTGVPVKEERENGAKENIQEALQTLNKIITRKPHLSITAKLLKMNDKKKPLKALCSKEQ